MISLIGYQERIHIDFMENLYTFPTVNQPITQITAYSACNTKNHKAISGIEQYYALPFKATEIGENTWDMLVLLRATRNQKMQKIYKALNVCW